MTQEEKQAWAKAMAEAMAKAQQPVVVQQKKSVESATRAKSLLTPANSWLYTPKSLD
mgnify:CR=1 FL=1